MRPLLLIALLLPWQFMAFGEAPGPTTPKKSKPAAKKPGKPADADNLSAVDRRALFIERTEAERWQKHQDQLKVERTAATKKAAALDASLKSASEESRPAILFQIGATYWRTGMGGQALRYFRQVADPPGELAALARLHVFDILLYENHDLVAARALIGAQGPMATSDRGPVIVAPRAVPDRVPAPEVVAVSLAARRGLVDFLDGPIEESARTSTKPQRAGMANSIWGAISRWKPEYPVVFDESSDATWLLRLGELHFLAGDCGPALALFDFTATSRSLHPTKTQKSYALFRRADAAYQVQAHLQPSERGPRQIAADYALAVKTDKDAPWSGDALFLQGNVLWNRLQDEATALKVWKEAVVRYPQARLAEKAACLPHAKIDRR